MINEIILNLKALTLGELQILQQNILKEKDLRTTKKTIYTQDCFDSSDYHIRKYKHFAKKITAIDSNKTNGFAFLGEFLDVNKENLVSQGSYIVEVCSSSIKLYRAFNDSKELLLKGSSSGYVSFIRKAKEITGL